MRFDFLKSYEEWRYCIEKSCQIPLSKDFIEKRLQVFADIKNEETERFVRRYGSEHYLQVLQWFQQARRDLGVGS